MERGKARPDTTARAGGERETTEQQKLRGAEYRCGEGLADWLVVARKFL
jgi:hypothetical protein